MKLGILGTGTIVQALLPDLKDLGAEKAYLLATPRSKERAQGMVAQFGLTGAVYDYDKLLALDIDTVYVALPNSLHYEYTQKALLAGKHVILEKPAVARRAELEELAALAKERDLVLVEAVPLRHRPGFQPLREAVGKLGKVRLASLYYCQRSRRYDDFLRGVIHPVFDPQKAGGALMDLNLYNIHAMVGLFGAPKNVEYRADIERGIDVSGVLTLDYGDFQAAALGSKNCPSPDRSVIMGEEGFLEVDLRQLDGYTFTSRTGEREEIKLTESHTHRLLDEFLVFKDIIARHDMTAADKLMADSLTVAGILETARKKAGVVFPGDEN
ncbi:MAG: Gfo/Idh/MocA family oxidoreductase [Oscillospiraceae bacterium]|nr:Gfo/Idh/MocA family oxidoreductase [Oscillospiraceae bacterium]